MSEISGFLLIDKEAGISSFDVIRRLRRITGVRKIGHTGTLDPFATGLLICALGSHTRLCKYLESENKCYTAVVKFGEKTTTGDTEGEVCEKFDSVPETISESELEQTVLSLTELPTPQYSAVKIQGKPAYEYARKGLDLDLPQRPVCISSFEIVSYNPPYLTYDCQVSKGTYIRSLSEYIALSLGTVGHTIELRRTSIGNTKIQDAQQIGDLTDLNFADKFYPTTNLFGDYEQIQLSDDALAVLKNGQSLKQEGADQVTVMLFNQRGQIMGVGKLHQGYLLPLINLS